MYHMVQRYAHSLEFAPDMHSALLYLQCNSLPALDELAKCCVHIQLTTHSLTVLLGQN